MHRNHSTPAIAAATVPAATLALKNPPTADRIGTGCCCICLPPHPCSISFVHVYPPPCSPTLYAPGLHSFVCICACVCACIHAHLYAPAYVSICLCLHSHSFVCTHLCLFVCACICTHSYMPVFVLICSACIHLHPHLPHLSVLPSFVHAMCTCMLPLTGLHSPSA